jgi:fibro-slime domain-containing protein
MMRRTLVIAALAAACGPAHSPAIDGAGGGGDDGGGGSGSGSGSGGGDAESCGQLAVTFRDFKIEHPDFEVDPYGDDRGLVKVDLGGDGKPVYAPAGQTLTVMSQTTFDQWYRDVPGVNMTFQQTLPLVENPPGTFTYDNQAFFPLDGMGWGDEGNPHNFHFTSEVHTTFRYRGGENFAFTGDDDLWVFVNNKLAIDLGGIHGAESAMLDFDARAAELGITVGNTYQLDLFHAERHTTASTFRVVTTIDCFIIQ